MGDDFDKWNLQKKNINNEPANMFFRRREIWWCRMGLNIGYEQNGKGEFFRRPVLIIKKLSKHTFLGVPVTTKNKEGFMYKKFVLSWGDWRVLNLGQMRVFDVRRITKRLDTLNIEEFFEIVKAVQNFIEPLSSSDMGISPDQALPEYPPEANTA
jgi:mRNA-degrading endonuclease toxin of MazEF toxin-antitoxin module